MYDMLKMSKAYWDQNFFSLGEGEPKRGEQKFLIWFLKLTLHSDNLKAVLTCIYYLF